jgi:uncharacterized protein
MDNFVRHLPEAVLNEFVSRSTLATSLTSQDRDIYKECGYKESISVSDYSTMYHREGIARRVVRVFPDESWAVHPIIFENKDGDDTAFETEWKKLLVQNKIFHYLHRADVLSGIGRFGVILLGIDDGKDLRLPVSGIDYNTAEATKKNSYKLLYIKTFDESVISISAREMNPNSPRYGFPTLYRIKFESTDEKEGFSAQVHWTRLIHIADNREGSEIYGSPRMKPVYNRLYDILKILGGSGEMFWKGGFPGISLETHPDFANATIDTDAIKEQMESYMNGLQRYLATQGITVKHLPSQVASPKEHLEANINHIAMTLGVPLRLFLGTEEAKLASSQDKYTWNSRLSQRQTTYLTPYVIRPFIDRLINFGVLPATNNYEVQWPDLNVFTDREKADVAKVMTESLSRYVADGISSVMPLEKYLSLIMRFSNEEIKAIKADLESQEGTAIGPAFEDEIEDPSGDSKSYKRSIKTVPELGDTKIS